MKDQLNCSIMMSYIQCCLWHAGSGVGQSFAVTGGRGALGSLVGSWAAALGASHVSLLARSAHAAEAHPAARAGVSHISVIMCDVGLQADVSAWLASCADRCAVPEHIFHASRILGPLSACPHLYPD